MMTKNFYRTVYLLQNRTTLFVDNRKVFLWSFDYRLAPVLKYMPVSDSHPGISALVPPFLPSHDIPNLSVILKSANEFCRLVSWAGREEAI
jgi:hypothetical protein